MPAPAPLYPLEPVHPEDTSIPDPSGAPVEPEAQTTLRSQSLEIRLGTYWFARIGIGMLLAGLVFFASYAYQNYVGLLGPGGRLVLLYLAGGLLLGAGTWWQRDAAKETLKRFGQVVFAGGLASVYVTTYAAHYFDQVRVIDSPLVDGVLLLGWAGFIVWIAERKKSELLAVFAVVLACYSAIITRVGTYTLYSNLVLTVAAVIFLMRNRWAGVFPPAWRRAT